MDDYAAVILVDATTRGAEPGSLYVFEPDLKETEKCEALPIEAHGMAPERVLRWVQATTGSLPLVRFVGCEPAVLGDGEDVLVGLSDPVMLAIPRAIEIVLSLVDEILSHDALERV
jgi:hydrogenase maturation protease